MIVGLLGPADAFVLRGLCSTMRGAFRADLTERAMAGEILVQLRAFAVDAFLAGMEVGGAGVGVEGSGGAEVGARLSVASSGETAMSSSPSLAPHGGWFTARPPASPRFRPSVYGNGSGGTVFSSSSCSTTTFVDPGDPVRLHHHIDAFLIRALGAEPDRHTDDFTEWAGYDPSLTGLAMAERRDEWLRKGGGSRGRSRSRRHVEWEAAMVAMSGEIKALLCRVWAISGKLYPFSKAENGVWKERKRARLVKEKAAAEREKVRGAEKGKRCGTGDQSSREAGGKQEAEDEKTWEKTPRKPRRPNRSGSPDFHRSILADHRTIDYYVANLGGQLVKPMLGEGRLSQATLTEMDGLLVAPVSPSTGFTPFTSASVPDLSTVHIDLAAAGNEASLSSSPAPTTAVLPGSQREVCRACLSLFTEDGGCRVLRFPPSLDAESRKSLHMAAQRLGLRTCSFGDGTKRFMVAVKKGVTIFRD
ncbi:hypothetical protein HK101_009698 [Irineochytrium annulatum]|nr:hypothetical protein HK101_009698 [Irineochytrium annulatum]